jgi:caa(3)-type oxidase subunit IV
MSEEAHVHHINYPKIYGVLLVLLVISVLGPFLEIQAITLITAFGIAVVKAYLVATKFMHIGDAPKFITYIMTTCLVFMLLFFAAVAPDVMADSGDNWKKNITTWHYSAPAGHHAGEPHASSGH